MAVRRGCRAGLPLPEGVSLSLSPFAAGINFRHGPVVCRIGNSVLEPGRCGELDARRHGSRSRAWSFYRLASRVQTECRTRLANAQVTTANAIFGRSVSVGSSVNDESSRGILVIGEAEAISDLIEAFFVESSSHEIPPAPVAGCDAGTAKPRFQLAVGSRDKLHLHPRNRYTHKAGPIRFLQAQEGMRRRLC